MKTTQIFTPFVTAFEGIDKLIINPETSKLITVISNPCGGKSSFLLTSARELSDSHIRVAFYSLEMSKHQVQRRLVKIRNGVVIDEKVAIYDSFHFDAERYFDDIINNHYNTIFIDGISNLARKDSETSTSLSKISEMLKHLKKLAKKIDVSVIISLNADDLQINNDSDIPEIISPASCDLKKALQQYADVVIFLDRPAFYNPEKRDNPEIITAYVFNNPEGFAGEEKLLFDRNLARFEDPVFTMKHNSYIPEEPVTTIFIACLDGSDEALHHAYRSSIRMLADHSLDFGDEGEPYYLDFNWDFIDRFRVLTVKTDGAGITHDFSNIPGITDCLWVLYDDCSGTYTSNDTKGVMLNRKKLFGIPEADYEVEGDSIAEVSGTITFDIENPDSLQVDFSED